MIILVLLICIAAIAVYKLLPVSGSGYETFTDIIIENVSESGTNKSGELHLFWLILIAGIVLLFCALFLKSRLTSKSETATGNMQQLSISDYRFPLYGGILVFPFLCYLLIFRQFSIPLFTALILCILCRFVCRKQTSQILLTFTFTYYALIGLLTIAVRFTYAAALSSGQIYFLTILIALVFSTIILLRSKRKTGSLFAGRLILILQCFLPGLLFVWLVDDYLYQGQLITVPYASGYTSFFIAFILFSAILLIAQTIRHWNDNARYFISAITPIILFVYHSFSAAPMYAQPDQHHHGEQMIPWNQVFSFGQSLYDEYTPVSGLFPFVNGLIQHQMLNGTVTDYSPAISITMVLFCIVTMYLIYKHVGGGYATAFAVFFTLPSYNRQYMMLPVLLLLTLPKLVQKKNLWLQLWIFSCFLSGLYYPLYGAALLIGLLPFAMYQLISYIKSEALRRDIKSPRFYITWVIFLIPIFCSIPLLFRMLKHTLIYSSQTIMADGISLLGQSVPEDFMPYLKSFSILPQLRPALYFSLRFLLPAVAVWVLFYCLFPVFTRRRRIAAGKNTAIYAFGLAAAGLSLMISYSYTLVRADVNKILSRTAGVLIAIAGIFLPVMLLHYGKEFLKRSSVTCILGICFALPFMIYLQTSWTKNPDMWVYPDGESQLVMDDAAKLYAYYEVPDTFLKSEDTGLPERYQALLGRGFMVADQIHYITDYASVIQKCEAVSDNVSYMAFDGQGFYDYLGVPCSATGYIPAARSYEAQKEIWDTASQNLPVVFYIQPEYNYYIFRFMLDEGYVYCAGDNAFYPPDLYAQIYGNSVDDTTDPAQTGDDYRPFASALCLQSSPESFASSMSSLQKLFIESNTKSLSTGNLPDDFAGMDYDFLYLELAEGILPEEIPAASVLMLSWSDTDGNTFEHSYVSCTITDSRLLIPMGMNACWLLSEIDDFNIAILAPESHNVLYETTYKRLKTSEEASAYIKELSLMQLNLKR